MLEVFGIYCENDDIDRAGTPGDLPGGGENKTENMNNTKIGRRIFFCSRCGAEKYVKEGNAFPGGETRKNVISHNINIFSLVGFPFRFEEGDWP